MIPSVLSAVRRIANATDPLKLHYSSISYKPFLSFFNMTGLVAEHALPPAIGTPPLHSSSHVTASANANVTSLSVNYAAALVLEVRQTGSDEPVLRLKFKNGTDDDSFGTYPIFGSDDVPISEFVDNLQFAAINTTREWCTVCGQTEARGCAELQCAREAVAMVGAGGFSGAGRTITMFEAMVLTAVALLGYLVLARMWRERAALNAKMSEPQTPSVCAVVVLVERVLNLYHRRMRSDWGHHSERWSFIHVAGPFVRSRRLCNQLKAAGSISYVPPIAKHCRLPVGSNT